MRSLINTLMEDTVAEPANKRSETPATVKPASQGVRKRGWSLPIASPITRSRAMENNSLVHWRSCVSIVATALTRTASTAMALRGAKGREQIAAIRLDLAGRQSHLDRDLRQNKQAAGHQHA